MGVSGWIGKGEWMDGGWTDEWVNGWMDRCKGS